MNKEEKKYRNRRTLWSIFGGFLMVGLFQAFRDGGNLDKIIAGIIMFLSGLIIIWYQRKLLKEKYPKQKK